MRGSDVHYRLDLDFLDAINGGKRQIMATQEFDLPRSIPIALAMMTLLFHARDEIRYIKIARRPLGLGIAAHDRSRGRVPGGCREHVPVRRRVRRRP